MRFVSVLLFLATASSVFAAELATPISPDQLDPATFADWLDGAEHVIQPTDARDNGHRPQWVIATNKTAPGHNGIEFGQSKSPGPRHLRVGFKTPVSVGAILVRGGVQVSVLKPDATYPGNLADEAQWIPAQRLGASREETGRDNYIVWTLPAVVSTRAIRFTHVAEITSREYAGWLGGAAVLSTRVVNIAPQAMAVGSADQKSISKINNESNDAGWSQWANIPLKDGERTDVVSAEKPEWVMLAWPAPVKLRGLGLGFAGFAEAEAQIYEGPADVHPREAPESAWKTIKTVTGLKNGYPGMLPVDWIDFGKEFTTRAVRLRITKGLANGGHPHTQNHPLGGKRVWLGELLALEPIADGVELAKFAPKLPVAEQPPIPVKFSIPEAGWVTLVIEDAGGKRVRNLIADTFFEKGEHTVGWDGSDDLGRDPSAAKHGLYYVPAKMVEPGTYRVRGLWRKQVDVRYEMGLYTAGSVPWETADHTGGWLANHTPPSSVLFVPDAPTPDGKTKPSMLIGSYVSEGTAGLAWVDLDGKKWRGQNWVGGLWTGAPYLARDAGPKAIAGNYAYVAAAWSAGDGKKKPVEGEIRITALTSKEDKTIIKFPFKPQPADAEKVRWEDQIGGLAVRDGVIAASLPLDDRIVLVDAATGKIIGRQMATKPRGLAFDSNGQLLVLADNQLIRFPAGFAPDENRQIINLQIPNLDEPFGLALDKQDNIYISERGKSHVVKMFAPRTAIQNLPRKADDQYGVAIEASRLQLVRTFGKPGVPAAGPYDPLHMNNPRGLAIDPQGRLWVAEEDGQPKRVSVWNADGSLAKAFYGPSEYGGGGSVDPHDKTKLYYNGMEFHLDFEKGTSQVTSIFYRPTPTDQKLPFRDGVPQNAIYHDQQRFWTNAFNSNPTGGHGTAFIFIDRDGIAVPCAGFGRANDWQAIQGPEFASVWPAGTDAKANPHTDKAATFLWQDLNGDGHVQPNELTLQGGSCGGVVVQSDLSFVISRLGTKSVRFAPNGFTKGGVPTYDMSKPQTLVEEANGPASSGGDQAMVGPDGWTIHTNAPKPYSAAGIGGAHNGVPMWSYPSLWPGLHASHKAPVPDRPGEVIGHTRLLGDWVTPEPNEPMFFLNGNTGCMYVFTYDGLFVTQLFQDMRVGRPWHMPAAQRGMVLNELAPGDENFWPNVTQSKDGGVYLVCGGKNTLAKIEGLDTVRRLQASVLQISPDDLNKARDFFARAEAARQAAQGRGVLAVAIRKDAPAVDGKLDDWAKADWAEIDKRGTRAYFNSSAEPYNVTGAVAISGDHLFAAWRTGDKDLLKNAGDVPNAPFKSGGALDLMIGSSDPSASDKRMNPVPGDVRLLITQVNGRTRALLYRPAVIAGEPKQPIPFSSPGRTITFDRVDDVSGQLQLASDGNGAFEISIPLSAIGLKPAAGQAIRGDIGILRGNGASTTQRVYWSNKATTIVADVPSEAELQPGLWGRWEFKAE